MVCRLTYGISLDCYCMSPDLWYVTWLMACRLTYGLSSDLWHIAWLVTFRLTCGMSPDLWHVAWLVAWRLTYGMSPDLWHDAWLIACRLTCGMSPEIYFFALFVINSNHLTIMACRLKYMLAVSVINVNMNFVFNSSKGVYSDNIRSNLINSHLMPFLPSDTDTFYYGL